MLLGETLGGGAGGGSPPFAGAATTGAQVAGYLRGLIHDGRIGPGDRLPPERALALELGVGRITLRQALRELGEHGYVEVRRGASGGTFVTDLRAPYRRWLARMRAERPEFEDMLDFRVAVESAAAGLAARRRTRSDLAALHAAARAGAASTDRHTYRAADGRFHAALAGAAHSPRLRRAVLDTRGELFVPVDQMRHAVRRADIVEAHRAIVAAVAARDPDVAAAVMAAHVEHTRRGVRRLLAARPREPAD